jgi:predicted PurR-regulated permease PerM
VINLLTPATRWGLNLLGLLGAVVALRLGETIFIPTVIAVLLAAMLWPFTTWLNQRLHLPWGIACLLSVGFLVLLNVMITLGFALAATKFLQGLPNPNNPDSEARQEQLYSKFRDQLERVSPMPLDKSYFPEKPRDSRIYHYIGQTLSGPYVVEALLKMLYYANNWIWQWVLVMFVLLFLLLEGEMLSRRVSELFGSNVEGRARAIETLADMAHQVRTYLVWRTIINFGLGLVVGIVYSLLGLQQAWIWALLTAILCYIPYIGPILAGVPPVLDAFVTLDSPLWALGIIGFYLVVITIEGYVITPVVMGRSMELNATTVMLACIFWELVWGTPGLFLAMPLMAAIKTICWHVPELRPFANLMSSKSDRDPPVDRRTLDISINVSDLEELARQKQASRESGPERA